MAQLHITLNTEILQRLFLLGDREKMTQHKVLGHLL